jgi:tetratricopeptide (TPR) repeat protein/DNA-binding CsgD family transcriptional regulator
MLNSYKNSYIPFLHYVNKIGDVAFTPREIDIISCILKRKSSIPKFLSISQNTVETHVHNIMRKTECRSRQQIIEFVTNNGFVDELSKHYHTLVVFIAFQKHLKKISDLTKEKQINCCIVYSNIDPKLKSIAVSVKENLTKAGIKVFVLDSTINFNYVDNVIFFAPFDNQFFDSDIINSLNNCQKIFISFDNDQNNIYNFEADDKCIYLSLKGGKNYYSAFFNILRNIFKSNSLEPIIQTFLHIHQDQFNDQDSHNKFVVNSINKNGYKFWFYVITLFIVLFLSVFQLFSIYKTNKEVPVRSNLIIPNNSVMLKRSDLIDKIEKRFDAQHDIQTIVLIAGMGGVGKTTTSRHYGLLKGGSVVWEINAETKASVITSFKDLAYAIAQEKEQKEELKIIDAIQESEKKHEQFVSFVKKNLRQKPNWILIFDNLENFSDIKDCFPNNIDAWGKGRVIITTRNINLADTGYIRPEQITYIDELKESEALELFSLIFYECLPDKLDQDKKLQIINFLKNIPLFPLDVSIVAYYMKNTEISFDRYLEKIKNNNKEFKDAQTEIIQEVFDYTKTRDNIIHLSLEKMFIVNPKFADLMFFICLLDSQNIPVGLLKAFADDLTVDNFVYHLKKYSLVTNVNGSNKPSVSMHRSTQKISLDYYMKKMSIEQKQKLENEIIDAVEKYTDFVIEEMPKIRIVEPHYQQLLKNINFSDPSEKAKLLCELGRIYFYMAKFENIESYIEESISIIDKKIKRNWSTVAKNLVYLGIIYREFGMYNQALSLLEEGVNFYKKHLTEHYSGLAKALTYLSVAYRELGQYEKSIDTANQSLVIYKEYIPSNLSGMATNLAFLGRVYFLMENYNKAKEVTIKSQEIYEKNFPENKFGLGRGYNMIGDIEVKLGNYSSAKQNLEKSLITYKDYIHDEHQSVGYVYQTFGFYYTALKDFKKAKENFEKSIKILEFNFGSEHITRAEILYDSSDVYVLEKQYDYAEKLLKNALKIFDKEDNFVSYKCLEKLSDLYLEKAKDAELENDLTKASDFKKQALEYLDQALKNVQKRFPDTSFHFKKISNKKNLLEKIDDDNFNAHN